MPIFLTKAGQIIAQYFVKYILDSFWSWLKSLIKKTEENKKDQENINETREAVKNGTEEDIVKKTQDMLNGN